MDKVEYRVRPVTRYIVTRYHEDGRNGGVEQRGEYDNFDVAYEVGYALARAEQDQLGWPPGDERMQYPQRIESVISDFKMPPVQMATTQ